MAAGNRTSGTAGRRTGRSAGNSRGVYTEGSAVRRLQEEPGRRRPPERPVERTAPQAEEPRVRTRQISQETRRNREKALSMNKGFVLFVAAVSTAILLAAVNFLQLKSDITASNKEIASLESELSRLKEDNDAYYSQVNSDIDLNRIKKIAVGRLGMKAPSKEQTRTYKTARSSYIRQYQDIPEAD